MSKLDKWRKIAADNPQTQIESNKNALVLEIASLPKDLIQENSEKNESENEKTSIIEKNDTLQSSASSSDDIDDSNENKEDKIGRQNRKINKEDTLGRQDKNIEEEDNIGSDKRNIEDEDSSSNVLVSKDFSDRVTTGVSQFIENKITKDKTHKKVGFELRNDLRMKLENFDKAHGGRIKGEFVNTLLDNFFGELEASSPQWKKILNKKIPNFK